MDKAGIKIVMKLDIIELRVKNWQKMLDWFTNTLGLTLVVKEDDDKFALVGDKKGLMIGIWMDKSKSKQRYVPYFKVDNLQHYINKLKNKSVKVGKIQKKHWDEQAKVIDPEDNELCVYQEKRNF